MKSIIIGLIAFSSFAFGQNIEHDKWCMTAHKMNAMLADPSNAEMFALDSIVREKEMANGVNAQKGIVYTIPVVFHILHNGGSENVDESQIMNALDVINRDFRLQNADTAQIVAQFQPIMADIEIEFALATIAPNGECFRGYTRTESPATFDGDDGGGQVQAIRDGNDVYQGVWPANEYLNVFVIADAGGAGGYTNYPYGTGSNMSQGIWILHTQFGEIGTSSLGGGRSLTHEIGHWLNLPHTWGSTNTPGASGNCGTDDGINDTPLTAGVTGGCPLTQADCGPIANVQNYMDYALSCQSMFTQGQATQMRSALTSSVGGRNNLWTAQNLSQTGADGNIYLCRADFTSDKKSICAGDTIQFDDASFNVVNGWTWSFPGGVPSSSTAQNPSVSYSTPGVYSVTLTATDGTNGDTEVKTGYIHVQDVGAPLPHLDHFEGYQTLDNIYEWEVFDKDGGAKWNLSTTIGLNSNRSAELLNNGEPTGRIDELVSQTMDLSGITTNMTLSFRYAYKRKSSIDDDWLRVLVSDDCGASWVVRKSLHGFGLSNETEASTFVPQNENDWTTVHMTNITSQFWIDNFRYKFQFESGGGNNIYLDNINIYEGSPSDTLVVGIVEDDSIGELKLYPNPAGEEINIVFDASISDNGSVIITDVSGKNALSYPIQTNLGKNLVIIDTKKLNSGLYFVHLKMSNGHTTKQFVVK